MNALRMGTSKARLVRGARRRDAADCIGELVPGFRIIGVTKGQFSLLDLIEAVVNQIYPSDVLVSTWTPGMAEMERVMELIDGGGIERVRLLVDRSFPSRHPKYVKRISEICGDGAIRMTRTHAKFALISSGEWRICIRTSMNFNMNPRLEQFDMDDNAAIYGLFERVAEDLFEDAPAGLSAPRSEVERSFARVMAR